MRSPSSSQEPTTHRTIWLKSRSICSRREEADVVGQTLRRERPLLLLAFAHSVSSSGQSLFHLPWYSRRLTPSTRGDFRASGATRSWTALPRARMTQIQQHKLHGGHHHPWDSGQVQLLQHRHHPHLFEERKKFVQQARLDSVRASPRSLLRHTAPARPAHHLGRPLASLTVPAPHLARSAPRLRFWLFGSSFSSPVFPYPTTFLLSTQPPSLYQNTS